MTDDAELLALFTDAERMLLESDVRTMLNRLAARCEELGRPVSDAPAALAAWLRREADSLTPPT